ncbi:hypothetical protein D3218_12015 [Aureimonas flava]|uniref:Uncharacterized protein n=2 Tax=Aureimonas flava TaxID=2320271 RepID=A0A3A1WJD9_9HYPH|nr:hypothetical protein D3218_12015 [Aureimonas flava]
MIAADPIGEPVMSITTIQASSKRRRQRAKSRRSDAMNPARGIMVGFGLSAMIWAAIGALLLG